MRRDRLVAALDKARARVEALEFEHTYLITAKIAEARADVQRLEAGLEQLDRQADVADLVTKVEDQPEVVLGLDGNE